jgi:mycofactocin glycosyltransferase
MVTRRPSPLPPAPRRGLLPVGFRIALDPRVRFWSNGSLIVGGAPWRVGRVDPRARPFLDLLRRGGEVGVAATTERELGVARTLLDRGFAHPMPDGCDPLPITVVVPAYDRTSALSRCLEVLKGSDVLVIDDHSKDGTAVAEVASALGARVHRHDDNRGAAAARNTGLASTSSELVAFVDSDCSVPSGWLDELVGHFADPKVAMVAPRVVPNVRDRRLLGRHEAARSALDMGRWPEQVRPGARLGFVPTAAVVVRRSAIAGSGFDNSLRLGEDVDLVWRLVDAGWQVRYDPSVVVSHEARTDPREWITRRFEYGTSAADLASRHPGRLAPARLSAWSLAALSLLGCGRPRSAALVAAGAAGLLARQLRRVDHTLTLAPTIVAMGIVADAAAVGHALRREWWPLGATCLLLARRSPTARAGAACMLAPLAWEWLRQRPDVDPLRYTALRLAEDAAYGSGVIMSAVRARTAAPLRPQIRLPTVDLAGLTRHLYATGREVRLRLPAVSRRPK